MKRRTPTEIKKEVGLISAIISDNYMKILYEKTQVGYIECLDIIATLAIKLEKDTRYVVEWESFLSSIGKGDICWDDYIIRISGEYLNGKYELIKTYFK